jgi:hypothetical protein
MRRLTLCTTTAVALMLAAGTAQAADAPEALQPELQSLEWHIGQWVHRSEGLQVTRVCKPSLDGHYLTAVTTIKQAGELVLVHRHMVRWDPARQEYRSWVFSSNGDFATGGFKQIATQVWQGSLVGQTYDGKRKSGTAAYTRVDADTFTYRLSDRKIGGESLPDIEWDFHRAQPSP